MWHFSSEISQLTIRLWLKEANMQKIPAKPKRVMVI